MPKQWEVKHTCLKCGRVGKGNFMIGHIKKCKGGKKKMEKLTEKKKVETIDLRQDLIEKAMAFENLGIRLYLEGIIAELPAVRWEKFKKEGE